MGCQNITELIRKSIHFLQLIHECLFVLNHLVDQLLEYKFLFKKNGLLKLQFCFLFIREIELFADLLKFSVGKWKITCKLSGKELTLYLAPNLGCLNCIWSVFCCDNRLLRLLHSNRFSSRQTGQPTTVDFPHHRYLRNSIYFPSCPSSAPKRSLLAKSSPKTST